MHRRYPFYASAISTDLDFMKQIDALTRELGQRGKRPLPEAVPPVAPAPAPALTTTSTSTASAPTAATSHSSQQPKPETMRSGSGLVDAHRGVSLMEVSEFVKIQLQEHAKVRHEMESKMERQLELARETEARMEAKLEQLMHQVRPQMAKDAISDVGLDALQSRLQGLHDAKLLTDEEVYLVEDAIADCIDAIPTMLAAHPAVEKVAKMISLCEHMKTDDAFARQLRRRIQ
jgi:DNA-binding transcriptional MerR regulator